MEAIGKGIRSLISRFWAQPVLNDSSAPSEVAESSSESKPEQTVVENKAPFRVPDKHYKKVLIQYLEAALSQGEVWAIANDPIFSGIDPAEVNQLVGRNIDPNSPEFIAELAAIVVQNYSRAREKELKRFEHQNHSNTNSTDTEKKKTRGESAVEETKRGVSVTQLDEIGSLDETEEESPERKRLGRLGALTVRQMTTMVLDAGFTVKRRSNGHTIFSHVDGRTVVLPDRPEKSTIANGVQSQVLKIINSPRT